MLAQIVPDNAFVDIRQGTFMHDDDTLYSAAFIYAPGDYDARFHDLNARIDAAAQATPGYLGREAWRSVDGNTANVTYYWKSLDALTQFSTHPDHVVAKREYAQWYRGYHIVVAQVLRSYGDGRIAHITPNRRSDKATP